MNAADVITLCAAPMRSNRSTAANRVASWWKFLGRDRPPVRAGSDSFLSDGDGMKHGQEKGPPHHPAGEQIAKALDAKFASANGVMGAGALELLDLSHDAICVRSMSGVIQYWNRAAERLYGWTADDAVGRVSHALFKTVFPDTLDRIEAELMLAGRWEGELVHMLKNGSRVTVASRWSMLRGDASIPIAILECNSDISAWRRLESERARFEERLRQAEKLAAIGRFASGIAHDFNSVLSGILAFGEMLLDEAAENTSGKRHAQNVLTAAMRGRHLVHQILAYSRNERGQRTPTDVCRTVAETLQLVCSSLPESVKLDSTIPDVPLVVMGDATQLHQVVTNLCTNAVQAMPSGGSLHVAVEPVDIGAGYAVSHGTLVPRRYVRMGVDDRGCGIDEATLARIFEPFFTTKERGRGTGLGLALVYAIVTDLDGAIDVKSMPARGSTFSIYIPMADATGAAPTA